MDKKELLDKLYLILDKESENLGHYKDPEKRDACIKNCITISNHIQDVLQNKNGLYY